MNALRYPSLALIGLLAAAGCGKSRAPETQTNLVTLPGGAADGSDVTVDGRWCVRCHGDATRAPLATDAAGVAFAPPVDLSGATSGAKVGAHQAHLRAGSLRGAGVDCSTCHVVPANADAHVPGVNLRALAATRLGAQPAYTPTFTAGTGGAAGSCASTYCHGKFPGGLAATVSWDAGAAAATCGSCHAIPPTVKTDGTTAHTSSTACGGCHDGYSNTAVNPATHVNGVVEAGGCTGCHGTAGRPNGNMAGVTYDPTQAAAPPVDTGGKSATTDVLVGFHQAHVNPDSTGVYKPIRCTECHPDNTAGGTHPNGGGARVEITWANATGANQGGVTPTNTAGNGTSVAITCANYCHGSSLGAGYVGSVTSWTWTGAIGGGATCGNCHADPPSSTGHTSAGVTPATNCGICHPGYSATTVDLATHINGQLDGGESLGGASCGGCHSTIFQAMNGTVVKPVKHTLGNVGGTNDSPTDSGMSWTVTSLTDNAASTRSCVNMCHGDHPHTLTTPAVATHEYNAYLDATVRGTATTSTTRTKTDFDATAANGGLCVSCHRTQISPARTATIDKAAFDASAHDFTTFTSGATWTWQFQLHSGTFDRNCTKCHASAVEGKTPSVIANNSATGSVHYNVNPSLLAGTTTVTAGVTDLVCYNCHGSAAPVNGAQGNRSGKNIQAQFAKASAHITTGGSCLDCHDPHRTKAGTHATPGNLAGPPLQGASGAEFTGAPLAFWTNPVAGNFTAKTIVGSSSPPPVAGADVEATLCFKCHSTFGGAVPAGTTDIAKEFNPGNTGTYATTGTTSWQDLETAGGFHPILATAGGNLGAVNLSLQNLQAPWSNSTRNLMTCTDCHESNSVADPNGPHGSSAGFILKGPNTSWSSAVLMTSAGMPNGTFCANCHAQNFRNPGDTATSSRFSGHRNGQHNIPCMNCHAAIPHGGPRPGMLAAIKGVRTGTVPSPPPVIPAWDQTAPYYQGTAATDGTMNGLYLKSYPATNTTNWSQTNCGCDDAGNH